MARQIVNKLGWLIFVVFLIFIAVAPTLDTTIFLNRTPSMARGFYVKITKNRYDVGDIIIFKHKERNDVLIKYVAAIPSQEFCIDENAALWIEGIPVAQINIEKYPHAFLNPSTCQRLQPDELLVLGEHPDSFDSRYFGPIKIAQVIAEVWPLWIFK